MHLSCGIVTEYFGTAIKFDDFGEFKGEIHDVFDFDRLFEDVVLECF